MCYFSDQSSCKILVSVNALHLMLDGSKRTCTVPVSSALLRSERLSILEGRLVSVTSPQNLFTDSLFVHALIVQRLCSQSPCPHTTGGSSEGSPSPEVCGCRELGSQVQRARLSCAGAESRMRNPHITVSGAIRVQRAATEPRCRELGDPQVRRAGSLVGGGHA